MSTIVLIGGDTHKVLTWAKSLANTTGTVTVTFGEVSRMVTHNPSSGGWAITKTSSFNTPLVRMTDSEAIDWLVRELNSGGNAVDKPPATKPWGS